MDGQIQMAADGQMVADGQMAVDAVYSLEKQMVKASAPAQERERTMAC
jgi:hypothetical protein